MNAVLKPQWVRLMDTLRTDVKFGAPIELIELTPAECLQFIDEECEGDVAYTLMESIGEVEADKPRAALNKLVTELLGDITADRLLELRDALRTAVIDSCSSKVRYKLEEELT